MIKRFFRRYAKPVVKEALTELYGDFISELTDKMINKSKALDDQREEIRDRVRGWVEINRTSQGNVNASQDEVERLFSHVLEPQDTDTDSNNDKE